MEDKNINQYDPHETVVSSTTKNFVWGLIGILLGLATNKVGNIMHKSIDNKYAIIIIQLLICSLVLAFVHVHVSNEFGWSWQNVTPGLFFVSFFFGCQFLTFVQLQETWGQ